MNNAIVPHEAPLSGASRDVVELFDRLDPESQAELVWRARDSERAELFEMFDRLDAATRAVILRRSLQSGFPCCRCVLFRLCCIAVHHKKTALHLRNRSQPRSVYRVTLSLFPGRAGNDRAR